MLILVSWPWIDGFCTLQIAMGLLGLGFLTTYMPEPLTRGFTTGAAFHVFASQMKHVFGIAINMTSGNFKFVKVINHCLSCGTVTSRFVWRFSIYCYT
jgi:MFS superfamily sulfate permease-like transporter